MSEQSQFVDLEIKKNASVLRCSKNHFLGKPDVLSMKNKTLLFLDLLKDEMTIFFFFDKD